MKDLKDYLALPYTKSVKWSSRDQLFVASIKEIEGCTAHGDSEAAALEMLQDNLEDWIAFSLEEGDPIPVPEDEGSLPSGKWLQRVPRTLHRRLIVRAEEEGVSLNSYVSSALALAVGAAEAKERQSKEANSINLKAAAAHTTQGGIPPFYGQQVIVADESDIAKHWLVGKRSSGFALQARPQAAMIGISPKRNPYLTFVHTLVEQLPGHYVSVERVHREEEDVQDRAYA